MKRILLIIIILNLFTGQAQDTDLPYESQWSLDKWELSKNKDAIRLVLDLQKAVENNDYEATRSMVSDSINILTSDGVRIQGIDEFEANFKSFIENSTIMIKPQGWLSFTTPKKNEFVLLWTQEEIIDSEGNLSYYNAHEGFFVKDGKIRGVNQWHRPRPVPPSYVTRTTKIVNHLAKEFDLNSYLKAYVEDLYLRNFLKTSPLVKKAKDNGEDTREIWKAHSNSIRSELVETFGSMKANEMLKSVNAYRKEKFNDKF